MAGSAALSALCVPELAAFTPPSSELLNRSARLLDTWIQALMPLQVTDKSRTKDYGGFYCAADRAVHGRVGDTIYPLLHLAEKKRDHSFLDSAMLLYEWMETHVSQPDGSWLNEPVAGSWKGTTVFAAIALAESLKNHGALLEPGFKSRLQDRLRKAGDFVFNNFTIDYGNINYPVSASYGLALLGQVLDMPRFTQKGKELAYAAMKCFTSHNKLLYGEGDLLPQADRKGSYAVDLGYNVEESLPSLAMYGLLAKDAEVLDLVTRSLQGHLEFMLPDGGWDNSWGTRNYKWTYWGSRTSDGCHTAYALMADRNPQFYEAALRNLRLLNHNTGKGLLTGGPHCSIQKVTPCIHHTFSHAKSLATILDYSPIPARMPPTKIQLPRDPAYGSRFMSDVQTWLVAKGPYRATVTAYDKEYKNTRNGHASGGALTLLWHEKAGLLFCASMNEYQLVEAGNMLPDPDPDSMSLTPRLELRKEGNLFMNISDLNAGVLVSTDIRGLQVTTLSKMVDKNQRAPYQADLFANVSYLFTEDKVVMQFRCDDAGDKPVRIVFPLISTVDEPVTAITDRTLIVDKKDCRVKITADAPIERLPAANGRIFNYVPGLQAIPLCIRQNAATIQIEVL